MRWNGADVSTRVEKGIKGRCGIESDVLKSSQSEAKPWEQKSSIRITMRNKTNTWTFTSKQGKAAVFANFFKDVDKP